MLDLVCVVYSQTAVFILNLSWTKNLNSELKFEFYLVRISEALSSL